MREYKFRTWDKERREMRKVELMDWSAWWVSTGKTWERDTPLEFGERNSFMNEETDRHILMQYIGVDDEEENEIFEGDNIRIVHEGEIIVGNVQYCGGGFILASDDLEDGFAWISDLTENDGRNFWIPHSEVIGNRWENPKLLEGEENVSETV